jgi:hypothetical protein
VTTPDVVTDQPFDFIVESATYRAHQDGTIERQDGDSFIPLPYDEGQRVFDAYLAQEG